ncbi:putative aminotransferase class-V [Janibacter sp. HTCC2649]|uniref:aminotransferase class V-fold PLP-dependent enzyme n=1 Tax=Janibacter sp. HTCC2649 TaxID=313589 RepID=UPI000066ECED|nr:aminotransferase class V-fold PLP-dependent enzyme [Janibacter sp. HTCC2649]EAP99520.1 putative aminotransferase class-V [Janibacter sp. HTCC2649]
MTRPRDPESNLVTSPPGPLLTRSGQEASSLFALDPALRHLNHGSFGAPLVAILEEQERLRREAAAAPVRWFPAAATRVGRARAAIAPHLGVSPDQLALVVNASAGASAVYGSLDLPRGCEIVVTDHGYGAVTMGADRLARRLGGRVVVAEVALDDSPERALAAVLGAFTDRTAMVVVDHVTSPTARELPVAEICAAARTRGVVSLVDAAHAPMLIERAATLADADYWVGNLHKFGCASPGAAVLVTRPGLEEGLWPLIDSWGGSLPFPERFDHQGTLDITPLITAGSALDLVEDELGWDRVRAHTAALADAGQALVAAAMSRATGVDCLARVASPATAMRLVTLPAGLGTTVDAANALRERVLADLGIEAAFTSCRGRGYVRLSFHAYNVLDDYADFADRAVPHLVDLARREGDAVTSTGAHGIPVVGL